MTQENGNVKRIAEFNALFLTLDSEAQEAALTVLKSLGFAQSVMQSKSEQPRKPPKPPVRSLQEV